MPNFKTSVAVALALLGSVSQTHAEESQSALFISKTQSPEWSVLTFGGPVAEKLYEFMEMQGELSCNLMNAGSVTCNAWVNAKGDLRNAAPEGAEQVDMGSTLPGTITFQGTDPDDSTLALIHIQSGALVNLLNRPIGHDLYCQAQTCQFTIDTRGAIDPRPFSLF